MEDILITRNKNPKANFSPINEMIVESGTVEDWHTLKGLHYKAQGLPVGCHFWRCMLGNELIGVCVVSMPKLLLKERHIIFPKLDSGGNSKMTNQLRIKWINTNMRVIARFVVDTRFRGIGVGYRFLNLAARMERFKYVELQSSMSKYNMFAQKAGFNFISPMNSFFYIQGMKFFKKQFKSNPADYRAILAEIDSYPKEEREIKIRKIRDFYLAHSVLELTGPRRDPEKRRVEEMPIAYVIKNLQQLILASPIYGIYFNPDFDKEMPKQLPLTYFDNQTLTEPLKWSK